MKQLKNNLFFKRCSLLLVFELLLWFPIAAQPPSHFVPVPASALAASAGDARPSWQTEWDRSLEASKKEAKLVIYGATGADIRKSLTEGFEKAYRHIQVEYFPAESGPLVSRIVAEQKAGRYDVDLILTGATTAVTSLKPQGVLSPILPALIVPEVTDGKNWIKGELDFYDKEKQYNLAFLTVVKSLLVINTDLVKPENIKSLQDLLDPKWKGKIASSEPLSGPGRGAYAWIMVAGGAEYLKALRPQIGSVTREDRQLLEWVTRGRFPVAIGPSEKHFTIFHREGIKNLRMIPTLKEGSATSASSGSVHLVKNAPHPNATKIFINWLLSKDGQLAATKGWGMASQRLDVPPPSDVPEFMIPKKGVEYVRTYSEEFLEKTGDNFTSFVKQVFKP